MKQHRSRVILVLAVLALAALACGGSISTANIKSAVLSPDSSGTPETTSFTPDQQTFYCIVDLANAPDDTTVKAVWTAVDTGGVVEPNYVIDEAELTSADAVLTFDLANDSYWPTGQYKVDLYLNGELDRTIPFTVQ